MAAFGQPVTTPYGVLSQPERTQGEPYKAPAPPRSPNVYGTMSSTPAPVTSTASPGYSTVQRTDPRTGQMGTAMSNGGMTMDANTANPSNARFTRPSNTSSFTGVDGKPAASMQAAFAGRDALINRLQQQQSVYSGSNGRDMGRPNFASPKGFGQSQSHMATLPNAQR